MIPDTIQEVKVKQCGDGKIKKEYLLPGPMTREMVTAMKPAGEVYIMDYLADPVYTIIHETTFNMRGAIGKKKIEVWYSADELEKSEEFLLSLFISVLSGTG
jgi:hypothetical protein